MKTIENKSHRPIKVPLPQGKFLHLGPGKKGQVADHAEGHPGFKRLLDAGDIEIIEAGGRPVGPGDGEGGGHPSTQGHVPRTSVSTRGDRGG